jgi:HlyD family secretion protein
MDNTKQKITTEDINKALNIDDKKKNFFLRYWWQLLLIIAIALGLFYYFTKDDEQKINNFKTIKLEKKDLVVKVIATGNLEPIKTVDIGIEVSGTIKEVLVDYSDKVVKNQVLARLDTTKLLSQVNNSKALLDVAIANLKDSKISLDDEKHELQRIEDLYKSTNGNYPTVKEIDQAKIAVRRAEQNHNSMLARITQSEATLKSDQEDLNKAVVVSPIDGIILDKKVDVGQSVVASMQVPILFTLAQDLSKMQVVVSIDEADVGKVKEAQDVSFSVDAYPAKIFYGKLKQVRMNSQIVNGVVTYEALAIVDNSALLLRPGMTVSANIVTKVIKGDMVVPNTALRFSPNLDDVKSSKKYIFSAQPKKETKANTQQATLWILKNGEAIQIPIEVGDSDGMYTIIKSDKLNSNSDIIIGTK